MTLNQDEIGQHSHHRHRGVGGGLHALLSVIFHLLAPMPFALCLVATSFLTIVHGGGAAWWLPLALLALTLAFGLWSLVAWWRGTVSVGFRLSPTLLLPGLPLLMGLLQLLPGSDRLWGANASLWSAFNAIAIRPGTSRLSLSPDATLERLALLLACTLLLFVLTSMGRDRQRLKMMMLAVMAAALGNALLAYGQYLSSGSISMGGEFHGAFLNRNHFAFLMMMGILSCLGLGATMLSEQRRQDSLEGGAASRGYAYAYGERLPGSSMTALALLALVVFLLVTAQVLSLSRGAFIGMTVAATLFMLVWLLRSRHMPSGRRQSAMALTALLGGSLAVGLPVALTRLSERYKELEVNEITMDSRWLVWRDTVQLLRDFWPFGVGLGGYGDVIQRYESGHFTQQLVEHAHNDYLELASEMGVPLLVGLLALSWWLWARALRRCWHEHGCRKWIGLATALTVVGVSLHELVEFNLLAWPNALVFFVVVATLDAASARPVTPATTPSRGAVRRGRLGRRLPLLALGLASLSALPWLAMLFGASLSSADLNAELRLETPTHRPGRHDYERRRALVEQARGRVLNQHRLLRNAALTSVLLAEQKPADEPHLLDEACQDIAEAARRAPLDGVTAIFLARFHDLATGMEIMSLSRERRSQLYDWAAACQPTLLATVEDAAAAAFQSFVEAASTDEVSAEVLERARSKAIQCVRTCLSLNGSSHGMLYEMLFQLCPSVPEMMAQVPENGPSLLALLTVLTRQSHHREALELIGRLEDGLSAGRLTLTPEERLTICSRKAELLTLTGRTAQLPQVWDEYGRLLETDRWEQEIEALLASGHDRQAIALLQDRERRLPASPRRILRLAQLHRLRGQQLEATLGLLRLTYLPPNHPEMTVTLLREALDCLGQPELLGKPYFLARAQYLQAALNILLAQRVADGTDVRRQVAELARLETVEGEWLQRHLIPLFRAHGLLLLQRRDEAADALRASLELCPDNMLALNLLHACAPERLTPSERQLHESLRTLGDYPVAVLEGGLDWLGVLAQPPRTENLRSQLRLDYLFVCRDDIDKTIRLPMTFRTRDRTVLFDDRIEFGQGRERTLRVGEIIRVHREWHPYLKALERLRHVPPKGDVFVSCQAPAFPRSITFAFTLDF